MKTYIIYYHDDKTDLDYEITIESFEMALRIVYHIIDCPDYLTLVSVTIK